MAYFKPKPQTDKRGTEGGLKYQGHQHNGRLYASIIKGMLYKRVITPVGRIMNYKPTKPNKYERRIFA